MGRCTCPMRLVSTKTELQARRFSTPSIMVAVVIPFHVDVTSPQVILFCSETVISKSSISCSMQITEPIEDLTASVFSVSQYTVITDFAKADTAGKLYSFQVDGNHDGTLQVFVNEGAFRDSCGNWNTRSNVLTLEKGSCVNMRSL